MQSFTYLGLVVSENNVPKNWLIWHYGDMAYNLPLSYNPILSCNLRLDFLKGLFPVGLHVKALLSSSILAT